MEASEKEEIIIADLTDFLNECLESSNQEGSFVATGINLETMKIQFEFDIVEVEEDNYIGFRGY